MMETPAKVLDKLGADAVKCMSFYDFAPNKLQTAVAMSATYLAPAFYKLLMFVIPAACGKTRIALATAIALTKKLKSIERVVVVYPNHILKS